MPQEADMRQRHGTKVVPASVIIGILISGALPVRAQQADWPTPLELRRDLAAIGWVWGIEFGQWKGGYPSDAFSSVRLSGDPNGLRVSVLVGAFELDLTWPDSVSSDW